MSSYLQGAGVEEDTEIGAVAERVGVAEGDGVGSRGEGMGIVRLTCLVGLAIAPWICVGLAPAGEQPLNKLQTANKTLDNSALDNVVIPSFSRMAGGGGSNDLLHFELQVIQFVLNAGQFSLRLGQLASLSAHEARIGRHGFVDF